MNENHRLATKVFAVTIGELWFRVWICDCCNKMTAYELAEEQPQNLPFLDSAKLAEESILLIADRMHLNLSSKPAEPVSK